MNASDDAKKALPVTLIQVASSNEPALNRARLSTLLAGRDGLVVLPEAFACDFGDPGANLGKHAEPLDGPFVDNIIRYAGDATIVAGMFEVSDDPGRPFNTLVVADSSGVLATYRKIHLYDSFGYRESSRVMPGELTPALFDVRGMRIGLMTCYDLRFPELARAIADQDAELLVVAAAWLAGPQKAEHWRTLVAARAIENVCYVAAVGQPAPAYTGHSMIVDPMGRVVSAAGPSDAVLSAAVDPSVVSRSRAENPSLHNRKLM